MKKVFKKGLAAAMIVALVFSVSACGPSVCDCIDPANADDMDFLEKCAEKMADMSFNEIQEATESCDD